MHLNIVCPFCERKHPVPLDFDDVYKCGCGANYRICSSSNLLDDEMTTMAAKNVLASDLSILSDEEEMGFCQVVVNREFDRLISLKQSVDETSEMRFCKYDPSAQLALVWLRRP
jgi:hypothetical protein